MPLETLFWPTNGYFTLSALPVAYVAVRDIYYASRADVVVTVRRAQTSPSYTYDVLYCTPLSIYCSYYSNIVETIESAGILVLCSIITAAALYAILLIVVPRLVERRRYRPLGIITTQIEPGLGTKIVYKYLYSTERFCYSTTRLKQVVLKSLIEELTNRSSLDNYRRARVAINKQVVIFLHFVAYNLSISELVNSYYYIRSTCS